MVNEKIYELGAAPNFIRATFQYGLKRKAEIGNDKVFDLSLGNPCVPSPTIVDEAIASFVAKGKGTEHAYTSSPGDASCRQAIADNIKRRFNQECDGDNLYLTHGASSAIAITYRALTNPGDEHICIVPYFMEYRTWICSAGGITIEVPAREDDFQLDVPAIEAAITERTQSIIINSPNNPVGSMYTDENLQELAAMMSRKSDEVGHLIYLISDEPYREIYYGDTPPAWVPSLYPATIVCYSWSKSFSLPGERIGYIFVPPSLPDWEHVYTAICGAGRALGYICTSTMFQHVVAECIDTMPDIEPYRINREILTGVLRDIGYTLVNPDGAFYLWIKALEPDANKFYERAKKHELLLVPSDGFGIKGWVRAGYCVSEATVRGAAGAFAALWEDYHH